MHGLLRLRRNPVESKKTTKENENMIKEIASFLEGTGIGNYPPFSLYYKLDNLIYKANILKQRKPGEKYVKVQLMGEDFWVSPNDFVVSKNVWREGVFEKRTTALLEKIIKNKNLKIAVDVGAHIGYYTVLFSKWIQKDGKVFAFEPGPRNFELLKKNTERENVYLEKKAVSDEDETVKLFLDSEERSYNRILKQKQTKKEIVSVESIKLDSYFSSLKEKIDIIKIDVEGAEPLAIDGMVSILEEDKPDIIMEYNHLRDISVFRELTDYGYGIFLIKDKGELQKTSPEEVGDILKTPEKISEKNISFNLYLKEEN